MINPINEIQWIHLIDLIDQLIDQCGPYDCTSSNDHWIHTTNMMNVIHWIGLIAWISSGDIYDGNRKMATTAERSYDFVAMYNHGTIHYLVSSLYFSKNTAR